MVARFFGNVWEKSMVEKVIMGKYSIKNTVVCIFLCMFVTQSILTDFDYLSVPNLSLLYKE